MMSEFDEIEDDDQNVENTYLTFLIAGEEYAVPVVHVTEIVRLHKSFAVPDVPDYVRGVINLRGKVIPLLDVRARFGLPPAEYNDRTVLVVLELDKGSTAIIVDGVSEVIEVEPSRIAPVAAVTHGLNRKLVRGAAQREETVTMFLDVEVLLSNGEIRPTDTTHQLTAG